LLIYVYYWNIAPANLRNCHTSQKIVNTILLTRNKIGKFNENIKKEVFIMTMFYYNLRSFFTIHCTGSLKMNVPSQLALKIHTHFGCAASLATLNKLVDRFPLPPVSPPIGDTSLTHVMRLAAQLTTSPTPAAKGQ
jgi:hypothetical protein